MTQLDDLRGHYARLEDEDLLELAREADSLTPEALESLRSEIARRKLREEVQEALDDQVVYFTPATGRDGEAMTDLRGNATKERLFAAMIDNGVATALCILVAAKLPFHLLSTGRWSIAILGYLLYFFLQEAVWGSTLGKRVFGLQVVRLDGGQVGWEEAGWRTLLRILEVNPLLLGAIPGGLAIACSRRKQRLGDLIAGTVVMNRNMLASVQAHRA